MLILPGGRRILSKIPGRNTHAIAARPTALLRQVDGESLEVGQRTMGQCAFMRGAQHDAWCVPGLECFLPARRAQAPPITWL
jgi:hypothetical protein